MRKAKSPDLSGAPGGVVDLRDRYQVVQDGVVTKIGRRRGFAGTGMMNTPDYIDELEARRLRHERATRGKPEKAFGQWLDEKMRGDDGKRDQSEEDEEQPKGAKDPHMGLSPGQSPELAKSGKGRRAGRVIVKG